jgi:succinyl-diaminopimelate desuccinylase
VGNPAWNVIPASASARFNSRFNDRWTQASLRAEIERRLTAAATDATLGAQTPISWRLVEAPPLSDVFLTRDDHLIGIASAAIESVTGRRAELSTAGGTSDARFIKDYCPVLEFGPVGTTMHQIDEHVPLAEIEATALIYEAILKAYFAA